MKNLAPLPLCGVLLLQACAPDAPQPPKTVAELLVSIDAGNNCTLQTTAVECAAVAAVIRARYPTSKPRIDICLAKQARFEAAAEVMKSVSDAGFSIGRFSCDQEKAPDGR